MEPRAFAFQHQCFRAAQRNAPRRHSAFNSRPLLLHESDVELVLIKQAIWPALCPSSLVHSCSVLRRQCICGILQEHLGCLSVQLRLGVCCASIGQELGIGFLLHITSSHGPTDHNCSLKCVFKISLKLLRPTPACSRSSKDGSKSLNRHLHTNSDRAFSAQFSANVKRRRSSRDS